MSRYWGRRGIAFTAFAIKIQNAKVTTGFNYLLQSLSCLELSPLPEWSAKFYVTTSADWRGVTWRGDRATLREVNGVDHWQSFVLHTTGAACKNFLFRKNLYMPEGEPRLGVFRTKLKSWERLKSSPSSSSARPDRDLSPAPIKNLFYGKLILAAYP